MKTIFAYTLIAVISGTLALGLEPSDQFLSATRQLTFEGRRSGEGYFSADGRKLVFQSEREEGNPFYQIYLLDLENGVTARVSPGHGKTTCAWIHPDHQRVLFASTHEDPESLNHQKQELERRASGQARRYEWDYDEHFDLYLKDMRSGSLQQLTSTRGYDAEGAISPDGQQVVFASNRHAYQQPLEPGEIERFARDKSFMMDIYIMNIDGSHVRRLTNAPGYDGGPFFSADGKKICWRRFNVEGDKAEVFTMNTDGTDVKQITRIGAMSWAPFFHPSGEYLIFTTNQHGFDNFELYLADATGEGDPLRVTFTPGFDGLPVFSPDGSKLAWTSNRTPNNQSQIFVADWDHEAALQALQRPDDKQVLSPAVTEQDLRAYVDSLTADEMAGRLTGTDGERLATAFVAEQFENMGLRPDGDDHGFFQSFQFTSGVSLGDGNMLSMESEKGTGASARVDKDWRPLAFSKIGAIPSTEVVFCGYGIVAPQAEGQPEYDSYVHLDVKDKWVMFFRYMPEGITPERRQHLSRYASLRYKAMVARERGAAGVIVVSGPNSKVRDPLVPLRFDTSLAGTSIGAISVTDAWASQHLGKKSLKELQDKLDTGEPLMGFELPIKLAAHIDMRLERRTGRNVIARLTASDRPGKSAIVIGAHVDHLGTGKHSGSLAHSEDDDQAIHRGADDNASGVAAMLEMAAWLVDQNATGRLELKHDIVFAAWSGEELGLLGSNHFVQKYRDVDGKLPGMIASLNLDMVGRYRDKLSLQGVGSSDAWVGLIERANVAVGISLSLTADSYLPTDSTSFYMAGVPSLSAFTGAHEDYHTPRDTPDKLNYAGLEKIARFMALLARGLATLDTPPVYMAQARPESGRTGALRAYLGTVPDYAQDESVRGVKLTGVGKGGPAEKAGVKAGDIIVELAGRPIENIYDYTYAIEALKIGQETVLIVVRQGDRISLKVTPASRD